MVSKVVKVDEARIQDCKEDIDTLMVFVRIMEEHDLGTRY